MNNIRYALLGFLLVSVLTGLVGSTYVGLQESYSFETQSGMIKDGKTIDQKIRDLSLVNDIDKLYNNIYKLVAPSNPLDALGALVQAGIGSLQIMFTIINYPVELIDIFVSYYAGWIPAAVIAVIKTIYNLLLAFIVLSAILKVNV